MASVTIDWDIHRATTEVDVAALIERHPKVLAKIKPGTAEQRLDDFINELIESGTIDPIDDLDRFDFSADRFHGVKEAALEHALLLSHREPTSLEIAAHALGVDLPPAPPQPSLFGAA